MSGQVQRSYRSELQTHLLYPRFSLPFLTFKHTPRSRNLLAPAHMPNLWSRDNTTSVIVDDQSPLLDYAYGGADWFNLDSTEAKGYNNNTLSATYVTGATMEITFLGVYEQHLLVSSPDLMTFRFTGGFSGRSTCRKQDIPFRYICHRWWISWNLVSLYREQWNCCILQESRIVVWNPHAASDCYERVFGNPVLHRLLFVCPGFRSVCQIRHRDISLTCLEQIPIQW